MTILIVNIEDKASLALNEFFDYNGYCYGLTCKREYSDNKPIDFEDFYEATITMDSLEDIPVVYVSSKDGNYTVLGWYRNATVYNKIQHPSFFLEGNIIARSCDAFLMPSDRNDLVIKCNISDKNYEVIDNFDSRYDILQDYMTKNSRYNVMERYPFVNVAINPNARKSIDVCMGFCEEYAGRLMNNNCLGIAEIKLLQLYSKQAVAGNVKNTDGFYYLAMADYHLGFVKEAIKAAEKALKLEPEASDIIALKAQILTSMKYYDEAVRLFQNAYEISGDKAYLILKGKTFLMEGYMDKAYAVFEEIEDKELLEDFGVHLKEMDRKWSFSRLKKLNPFKDRFK